MTKPAATLDVNILGHEFNIEFPDQGKMIDIALLKAKLSENRFTEIRMQISSESAWSVSIIDAFAHLQILLPQLKEDLKVKSLFQLSLDRSIDVVAVFQQQIEPWMGEWFDYISKALNDAKSKITNAGEARENLV